MGKNETNNQPITQEAFDAVKAELEAEKTKAADAETRTAAQVADAAAAAAKPLQERIASLELDLKGRDETIKNHKATIEEKSNGFASLAVERDSSVKAYAELVKKTNPLVPQEMITGNNVAEINASLEKAVSIVDQVKKSLETQNLNDRVPPGASLRTEPDTSSMSSKEKINLGLERARNKAKK